MAKIAVDITLVNGTDEDAFINSFDSIPEVTLKNKLPNSPTLLVLKVEESYIDTLKSDSRIVSVDIVRPAFSPSIVNDTQYDIDKKIHEEEVAKLKKEPLGSDVKKEYCVTCATKSDWDFIHDELEKDGSFENNIPKSTCACCNDMKQSDVRGIFLLTDDEAKEVKNHPKVIDIHINAGAYPGTYSDFWGDLIEQQKEYRYASTVKHQRDWNTSGIIPSTPTRSLENRCSSHLKRHMQKECPWQGGTGDDGQVFDDRIQQYGTGKDVDVIVCDTNVWFGHIEFQNDYATNNNVDPMVAPSNYVGGNVLNSNFSTSSTTGTCDALDLVLDSPYYIDKDWFEADASNRLVVRWDGTTVPTETAAKDWWSDSSKRSNQFANVGTVSIPAGYTRLNCNGSNTERNQWSGTHGTPCMSQAYGRQYGWAYNANKWFLSNISGNSPSIDACFDIQKIFHQNKPNRTADNTKNPTVSSNSWGLRNNPPSSGWYYFRPSAIDGTIQGVQYSNSDSNLPNRPAFMSNWTSDGSNNRSAEYQDSFSTVVAGKELVDAGVIFLCAAGNSNMKQVNSNDPDFNNYWSTTSQGSYTSYADATGYSPYSLMSGALEHFSCSRRGFPSQIGVVRSTTPYTYKTIAVGCLDDQFLSGKERKVYYSSTGNAVDCWTVGDESLAAQSSSWGGHNRYDNTFTIPHGNDSSDSSLRDTSNTSNTTSLVSKDRMFNGTSSACPIAAGIVATLLEKNRNWTYEDVKNWIENNCGAQDTNDFYTGTESTTPNDSGWYDQNNVQGRMPRVLWDTPATSGGGMPVNTFEGVPYTLTNKTCVTSMPSTSTSGSNYISLQHYLDSDIIRRDSSGNKIGGISGKDDSSSISNVTFSNKWNGKYIDIITMEAGTAESAYVGYQDSHPDFDDPDDVGNTRCVPMNWDGCEGQSNNQVGSNSMFSAHAIGTLSSSGGVYGGFAKKASLRACYLGDGDDTTELFDAIKSWHNAKTVNSVTGAKNPTIVIAEYQWLLDTYYAIKVEDITSVTDPTGGTTNRPGGGWGTNLTPFTSRDMYPYKVKDPEDNTWHWCITFPWQGQNTSLKTAMDQAWDAGIILINAAGNNGGTYVKENDARWSGTYVDIASGTYRYLIDRVGQYADASLSKTTTTTTRWYPFQAYGPHGHTKSIDVAAGQNSETYPHLDMYTNRGAGIDIVGLGAETWTSYPEFTFAGGHKWGFFSGTSCATPTVVGKVACMLERHRKLSAGNYPTPNELKALLVNKTNSRKVVTETSSITNSYPSNDWNNVPTASDDNFTVPESNSGWAKCEIKNGISTNGGFQFAELAGTTTKRAFFNAKGFNRRHTRGRRPRAGVMYPRPNNSVSNITY